MSSQCTIDLGEPRQNGFNFPVTLAERYQPKIEDFIGLEESKRILVALLKRPKPCNLLFVGPPGTGKTATGMSFAKQLPGSLVHSGAQKVDVAKVEWLWERFAYLPKEGWWVNLIDEMGDCTDKAQLQLLSRMDGTAALRPLWGGGFERGTPDRIINIFTTNGIGPEQTNPPLSLLPRFLSRCMILSFRAPEQDSIAKYLQKIWKKEGGRQGLPLEYFRYLAQGVGVRDALMRVDSELLRNPTIREVIAEIKERERRVEEKQNVEANKWTVAAQIDEDPAVAEAIANYDEAVRSGAPEQTISAKKAWVTMRRQAAKERLAS